MSKRFSWLWHQLDAWRQRQRARRQELRQRRREQQRLLWGGPVEADRVLAFSDAIFAIAITLLTLNLEVRPGLHGANFTRALHQVLPALGAYVLSFVILGRCGSPITASSGSSPAWTTRSCCATSGSAIDLCRIAQLTLAARGGGLAGRPHSAAVP